MFFFNDTATTEIYTLSLHDALPICESCPARLAPTRCLATSAATSAPAPIAAAVASVNRWRSEEHTSELQSQSNLVCRLLLDKNDISGDPPSIDGKTVLCDVLNVSAT